MKCTILGCGGSNGVPEIGCECIVCTSQNDKNKRTRASIFVESNDTKILIDTSADLRQQALRADIKYVDAILYTHDHSDHVAGIDETKLLSKLGAPIPTYLDQRSYNMIYSRYPYIFKQYSTLYPARLKAHILEKEQNFTINDIEVQSFPLRHGSIESIGFRFGALAYCTDLNGISERSFRCLEGVEVLVLDCTRYHWTPTHTYLELMFNFVARLRPKLTVLTHMAHNMEYDELCGILPSSIIPAFDGMVINF